MEDCDFQYDGLNLSDLGYIICEFDSDGIQTLSNGSQITFHTVPTMNGSRYELAGSEYAECLESTFQICKNPCENEDLEISPEDLRFLMKWLNRKEFYKFKLLRQGYEDLYFESSFNISRIEYGGKICGIELNMHTNRPYAMKDPISFIILNNTANGKKSITDISDEEGYIYPLMEIEIIENGDLSIHNALDNRTTNIRNCTAGEIITLDYPIIASSVSSHKIQDDFDWNFFRIANTFKTGKNDLTISIPCRIKITYSPIVKIGI